MAELFIGGAVDPATHDRTGADVRLDTSDLTTHGVIVGMTGSGKTGLAVVLIEEVLSAGIPALLIDPKGDLTNLCLTFPQLAPADFRPWVDAAQAKTAGVTPEEFAVSQATAWTDGLATWGYGPTQIKALRDRVDLTIYTPGSTAGQAIDLVGSLDVPETDDGEAVADQVEGFVTGLLGLLEIDADPLSSREHILLSNLIHHAWDANQSLDLPALVGQVQQPPLERLGVFELDEFFPPKDRQALAIKLNGLLASPSFAAWSQGVPLDIQSLLYGADGRPRCAIVTTAHLSDEERQFVTSLVLGRLITWMRGQSGTTDLRALLYMDEVSGYLPPTAMPATKKPIMTLMKQARAFGVGVVLATQNPVDIDYKAISNAGTWMVGRLQTERDKGRLLDGMSAADGGVDVKAVGDVISGLAKREFVLRRAGNDTPETFTTRWAMSYLRGPLTKDQIRQVQPAATTAAPPPPTPRTAPTTDATGTPDAPSNPGDAPAAPATTTAATSGAPTPVMPRVADGIAVRWLDASAAGVSELGGDGSGTTRAGAVVAQVAVRYDDAKLDVLHDATLVVGLKSLGDRLDPTLVVDVPVDVAALLTAAPTGSAYRLANGPIDDRAAWRQFERGLIDHVARTRTLALAVNKQLELAARPDESPTDFRARCAATAQASIDAEQAKAVAKHEARAAQLLDQHAAASDRAAVVAEQAADRKRGRWVTAASDILGGLFGSRRTTASRIGRATDLVTDTSDDRRVDEAQNKVERLEAQQATLDAELAAELTTIGAKWTTIAADITSIAVPAEKTDVTVTQLLLVWVPTA